LLRSGPMGKRVMVVDDSASLREVVSIALRGAGYEVTEAIDGQDALAKLRGERVNLVICDVNMPVMDGITFVSEVKKRPEYRFLPVLMLTTESRESRKEEGQLAGAKAWMVKPFRPEQILNAVSKRIAAGRCCHEGGHGRADEHAAGRRAPEDRHRWTADGLRGGAGQARAPGGAGARGGARDRPVGGERAGHRGH